MAASVIFLDLARQTGWCEGAPGTDPLHGTHRLAPDGAPPAAALAGLMEWLGRRLMARRYAAVYYEAPIHPRQMQRTNARTTELLYGLPGVVLAVAHTTGHYRVKAQNVATIRKNLLGYLPRGDGRKGAVIAQVRALGHDPADDNEADAIAGWYLACAQVAPDLARDIAPLAPGRPA